MSWSSLRGPNRESTTDRCSTNGSSALSRRRQFQSRCKSADNLDHLADASIDVIVMDPPYYGNVMYAELSDFFYVWLKTDCRAASSRNCSPARSPTRNTKRSRTRSSFKDQPAREGSRGTRLPGADGGNLH